VLDKAEYSAFESTLNSSIVSYRIDYIILDKVEISRPFVWFAQTKQDFFRQCFDGSNWSMVSPCWPM